jgi:signal transduction histidine kinase
MKHRPAGNFQVDLQIGPHRVFYKALDPDSQFAPAYDVCLYPLADAIRDAQILRWKIIAFGLVLLSCGFGGSSLLARKLSKPVDRIMATSVENFALREQAEKDLVKANRELEKTLNELRVTQQQVIQQERLSALGQMAAGIAHDFNNALMPILGFADALLANERLLADTTEAKRCLEILRTSAKDAANVVSRLREFYRPAESDEEFPIVDLGKTIRQAVTLTEPKWRGLSQARGINIEVVTEFKATPFVAGQESALREVLTNLLFNAVDAMPEGGRISLEVSVEAEHAVIRVSDTGTGMSEIVQQRCLEPFFSTKGEQGTGLGLSMVYGIIERHRGRLDIESALGKGTTFIIRIPVADAAATEKSLAEASPAVGSLLSVLIVDDEPRSRDVLSTYLRCDNHSVACAASGREALEKFRHGRFDLVVMDRVMPEMNGDQTARFIKQMNEDVPVILLTGFGSAIESVGSQPPSFDVLLNKPITLDTLRRTIDKLVYVA